MIKKRIVFLFSLLLLTTIIGAGCANNQDANNQGVNNQNVNNQNTGTTNTANVEESIKSNVSDVNSDLSIVITMDGQSTTYPVTIQKYSTALDVLRKVAGDNNLDLDTQESTYGVYVNGLAGKTGGDNNKYWLYYINGESATMSVVDYIINEGDLIEFKFE